MSATPETPAPANEPPRSTGLRWKLGAVLVVTGLCLAWVLRGVHWGELWEAMAQARMGWVLPVFAIYLTNHCIRSVRLRMLIDRPDIPFREMFSVTTIGFLAINVVPLRLGEFVRPYLLLERQQVPFGRSLAAIVVERLVDLMCLMVLLLLVGMFVELPVDGLVIQGIDVVQAGQRVFGVSIGVGLLFLLALAAIGEPVIQLVLRLIPVPALAEKLGGFLRSFHSGLVNLMKRPARALAVLAMSGTMWVGIVLSTWLVLHAFAGLPTGWDAALTTWTLIITGMTLIPTPGFFGSYEAFAVAALSLWGVSKSLATAFAGTLHLTQFLFIVGLGSIFLVVEGISLRSVVDRSRDAFKES
ncbi:MAG: lysylphosphatidylglycerol synthase transmembrane domain-containing protein [Myxococcota bacterium]|nr:lysylphosphatidylglycerol synthase transmembrane domain-containing protein [Myxococcota bacterium]